MQDALGRLFEHLPEIAWSAGADGTIDRCNERWRAYTGLPVEGAGDGVWERVHRADVAPELRVAWHRALETGERVEVEVPLRAADGTFRWFLLRAQPVRDDAGELVRWLGTYTDIDELKRLRVRQRLLMAVADMAVARLAARDILARLPALCVPDFADGCMVFSPASEHQAELAVCAHVVAEKQALLGQMIPYVRAASAPPSAPAGRELASVVSLQAPLLVAPFTEPLRQAIAQSPEHLTLMRALDLRAYLLVPIVVDGQTRAIFSLLGTESDRSFAQEDVRLASDFSSRIAFAVELAQAADERARRAEAERRATEEAERAAALAERFVGILGHDLRGPLHSIISGATLLARAGQGELAGRVSERVLGSAQRMARLVDQLLDVSRIRAGHGLPCEPVPVDLAEVLQRVHDELPDARARVVVTLEGPSAGAWDPDRLAQALSNVLGNALQHSPPESLVSVTVDGRDAQRVQVVVENEGAGVGRRAGEVFAPFLRGVPGAAGQGGGLGLGLYIARESVLVHGGAITLEPAGTDRVRFRIELPRIAARPSST